MLQLIYNDSGHFTQPDLRLRWSDVLAPVVSGKVHSQLLIESAQHSLAGVRTDPAVVFSKELGHLLTSYIYLCSNVM